MTKLLYAGGHLACNRYDSSSLPVIELVHFPGGYMWENRLQHTEIIFTLDGGFQVTFDEYIRLLIGGSKAILLPPGCRYKASTEGGLTAFVFRIDEPESFCERFTLERLQKEAAAHEEHSLCVLDINDTVRSYLGELKKHYTEGFRCSVFHRLKVKELFFLLRAYYPSGELAGFFRPLLSNDTSFMNFVLKNYRKVRTVTEFAGLYNSSVSSFDKKFRKTFGTAPYKWMMQKKIRGLYGEISTTAKPLKQIAKEHNFSSLPQFTDYCKKHFGCAPGKLRRMVAAGTANEIKINDYG